MIWYELSQKKPIATKKGLWDGLKSEPLLVCTFSGKLIVAYMYEGFMDGCHFRDFYDENDCEINNVKYWTEIDSPI